MFTCNLDVVPPNCNILIKHVHDNDLLTDQLVLNNKKNEATNKETIASCKAEVEALKTHVNAQVSLTVD